MTDKTKPVLVINVGWEQQRLVDMLLDEGYQVVGVHADPDTVPPRPSVHLEKADPRDLPAIRRVAQRVRPAAVVTDQCDYAHFASSLICAELGLPGSAIRDAQVTSNKFLNRQATHAAGIQVPEFVLCTCPEDALAAADRIGYPVVVKPVDNRGSFGITIVPDRSSLTPAVYAAITNSHSRLILVEQFIAGLSLIVEGYCFPQSGHQSLVLGTKEHLASRPQIHTSITFPGTLDAAVHQRVIQHNDRVVAALGLRYGMTSAEYVLDDDGRPWLMEMANRGGGVLISSMIVPHVSGVDTTRQLIYDAFNLNRDLFVERSSSSARAAHLRYIIFEPGRVRAVHGVDQVSDDKDVLAARYWGVRRGTVDVPSNALERHGLFISTGTDADLARANAERVWARIQVEYE